MVYKAKRVAVIGAGVSGVTSAKHLKTAGSEVVVYERSSRAGGNWNYDKRRPLEPNYPSIRPSLADFVVDSDHKDLKLQNGVQIGNHPGYPVQDEIELQHAPPGPAYDGLTNNITIGQQELKGYPWPEGTGDFVNVRAKGEYIRGYAKNFGVEQLIKYNTRVEKLEKRGSKWQLKSTTLVKEGPERIWTKRNETEEFDAVVIASGHYHAPKVPDIPGLKEWKAAWPERVQHSKAYRRPEEFKDQNVLIIGAGVSSSDTARELDGVAKSIYQSSRGGLYDFPLALLSLHTQRVAEVASLELPSAGQSNPGIVSLKDGTILTDIDRIIVATGYHMSYPFLPDLHADFTPPENASPTVLVTDGNQIHNLHKDIFYIPDPTLAFVGVPFYTATFTLFEFQAITVAAVLSGRAWLPTEEEMRVEYRKRVETKGYGRAFHSLRDGEIEYASQLVEWLNSHAEVTGAERVEGHSEKWLAEHKLRMGKLKGMFEAKNEIQRAFDEHNHATEVMNGEVVAVDSVA